MSELLTHHSHQMQMGAWTFLYQNISLSTTNRSTTAPYKTLQFQGLVYLKNHHSKQEIVLQNKIEYFEWKPSKIQSYMISTNQMANVYLMELETITFKIKCK